MDLVVCPMCDGRGVKSSPSWVPSAQPTWPSDSLFPFSCSNCKGTGTVLVVTFERWLSLGCENGWCGPPVCATHDGIPTSEDEDEAFEETDPCLFVVRLYDDHDHQAKIEANHPPTVWRK